MSSLKEIQAELKDIKKTLEEQINLLEKCQAIGNWLKNLSPEEVDYLNQREQGNKYLDIPQSYAANRDFAGLDNLYKIWTLYKNSFPIYCDSFKDMLTEIEDIQTYLGRNDAGNKGRGVPENMEGYRREASDDLGEIISGYSEIINNGFNSIEDICELMEEIIGKIEDIENI